MNPPPIGEALSVGWTTFKANLAPVLIGVFLASLLGIIPIVGTGLAFGGMLYVSLKALRGQTPEPKDGFIALQKPVDHIIMGLLQIVGVIACVVGMWVTQGLFFQGSALIFDKDQGWSDAKDRCLETMKPNLVGWTIFVLVVGLVGGLGSILCGIGVYLTLPIATIAMAYAYEQTLAKA